MFDLYAAAVPRTVIIRANTLTALLSISDVEFMRWLIVDATVRDIRLQASSLPLTVHAGRGGAAPFEGNAMLVSSKATNAASGLPWIPQSYSLYQSTVVSVAIHLRCVVVDDHNMSTTNISTLTLIIPAPGAIMNSVQKVLAAGAVRGQIIGLMIGAGSASSGGRLAAIAAAQCGTSDSDDRVTGILH